MSYLNPPYANNFQELCASMPLFYLEVLEMRAILRAQGRLLDDICDGVEQVVDYNFILTADEDTVRMWEKALKITPTSSFDLDIRKRVIIGYIIGLGHIGEPEIREIYGLFSNGHIDVGFSSGIIDLIVDIAKGDFLNANVQPFLSVLAQRIPAHLTLRFSYQYSACIKIKHRIYSWSYRVPECGTIRCGTWWMRHTLGWSERHGLAVEGRAEPLYISPELSGTLPYTKTPGYSLRGKLRIAGRAKGCPAQPEFTGMIRSGTEWMRRTLGWSEQAGDLTVGARPEALRIVPEFAGTLPEESRKGYTLVCGAVRSGGVATAFTNRPKEAGAPEKTGTWPAVTTAGHSVTTEAVRSGGGVKVFQAAPELAGTLPEAAVTGYAIVGDLTARADVDGLKITPEYTGTLPKEAQHGERED